MLILSNERLTKWVDDGEEKYAIPRMDLKSNSHRKCLDKLAEYEDLEEQNLLLKLPCGTKAAIRIIIKAYLSSTVQGG